MATADKPAERTKLSMEFGILLRPLRDLAGASTPPPASEYHITSARCRPDSQKWQQQVRTFTEFENYNFDDLRNEIVRWAHNLIYELPDLARRYPDDALRQSELRTRLSECEEKTLGAIHQVPIEWTARLNEAGTPFSVHLRIRDAILFGRQRVHYFDRYLNADFFSLYLRDLNRAVEVRLVTTKGSPLYGVQNVASVSTLAAAEFKNYQLLECSPSDLHDRNLRVDDVIFHLGASIKDAGGHPTNWGPGDSSSGAHAVLDSIIAKSRVVK